MGDLPAWAPAAPAVRAALSFRSRPARQEGASDNFLVARQGRHLATHGSSQSLQLFTALTIDKRHGTNEQHSEQQLAVHDDDLHRAGPGSEGKCGMSRARLHWQQELQPRLASLRDDQPT